MNKPPLETPIEMEDLKSLQADAQLAIDRLVFYKATCLLADALIAAGTGAGNVPALLQARMHLPTGAKVHPVVVQRPGGLAEVREAKESETADGLGVGRMSLKHRCSAALDSGLPCMTKYWGAGLYCAEHNPPRGAHRCNVCHKLEWSAAPVYKDMPGACSDCWAKANPQMMDGDVPPSVVPSPEAEAKLEEIRAAGLRDSILIAKPAKKRSKKRTSNRRRSA